MIQNRSFRDYIASRFHSELFEVVSRYITIFSNELKLQLWQQSIAQFEDLGLSKLNVLFVLLIFTAPAAMAVKESTLPTLPSVSRTFRLG